MMNAVLLLSLDWQGVAAACLVLVSLGYVLLRAWRAVTARKPSGCGGCQGCSSLPPLVQIEPAGQPCHIPQPD